MQKKITLCILFCHETLFDMIVAQTLRPLPFVAHSIKAESVDGCINEVF